METAASKTTVATAEQRASFERDGYLLIQPPGVEPETLDAIVSDLSDLYPSEGMREEDGVMYRRRRIRNGWKINEKIKSLALQPYVLGLLEDLFGRKPLPFQTLNFNVGTEQAPHSDTVHFNSMPPGYVAGVWVALEDIDMENGPVVYYAGSHRLPDWSMQDAGTDDYRAYERFIGESIEQHGLEPAYATMKKGEAIIWAANLLHGGSALADKNRSRHSQATHYLFEDCKYYQPLFSSADEVSWFHPEWIT